jgi:hypothetical protein
LLKWPDDLSCGPIDPGDPEQRDAWLDYGDWDLAGKLRAFWQRVETADERLVVWFGRHCANELAFFLNWADRMGDRPYDIVDVTGREFPSARPGGTTPLTWQAKSVSILNADKVRSLLGSERPVTREERTAARECWRRLKSENAPFRIVTETGLASAPIDHFDPLLLEQAGSDWRKVAYVVGMTMGLSAEPYYQVGDGMLLNRLIALVEAGKLVADGNPWERQVCRVRLAG